MASTALELPPPAARLETLPAGIPDLTLGYEAAAWAHEWLIQPNGPRAGQPFELTYDQFRFLCWFYAVDEAGRWLFNHAVRRLAKGSGKSPFAAVVCLIEFLAPVRLLDFDRFADGGCRGRPVDMPLVQIAATAESQTANTMRMVRAFAPKRGRLVEHYQIDVGKTQFYKLPEGTLEVITSSATSSEGAESSFICADETEHSKPSNGGPELIATLMDNLAKSGSRMLETCNAWVPGAQSVAESSWDAFVAQEEGRLKGRQRMLYDARIAPPDTDLSDYDSLRLALEWVYADCDWKRPDPDSPPDVDPIIERIWSPTARPDESKRKYLNWPTVALDSWTTPERWALLHDPNRAVVAGEDIVIFFDGSKSDDATAIVGCCVSDGHVFVPEVHSGHTIWEPDPGDPDDLVPVHEVDAAVDHIFESFNVRGFFGDVREWESFVKISWPERHSEALEVMAVPSGKEPQPIAWDMRSRTYQFTQEAELTEAEIIDQAFTHDGNPVLARHIANMRRRPNRYGVSVGKESPSSAKKIDAGVCTIGVRMVRRLLLAVPEKKSKKPGRVIAWGER